jgi:Calcium-dependent channel, 7TM region, putative phosphate/Late exocytosis, associated with Golgi transport/Cytosolic domain of 10TM putative phosphate transporter
MQHRFSQSLSDSVFVLHDIFSPDGYMLIRYINVCLKMSFFLTLLGLVVLVPVYSFAQNKHFSWTKYTLANIPNDPSAHQLWVPAIFAYIFSTYFCHLMYVEYRNFVKKRIQYLIQGDPDTPPQTYYTLMVEKVPINLRSAPALEAFFENLFPGDVHSVEVALDLKELDMMTKHRRFVRDSLEKSIALSKATGKQQLQWIGKDFYEDAPPFAVKADRLAKLFGCIVVDAIEHRTRLLAELNSLVRVMQLSTFEKRHIVIQEETRRQQNIHGKIEAHLVREVRNFFKAGISSFVLERDRTLSAAKSCLTTCESHLKPDLIADAELGQCETRCSPLLSGCSFIPSPRKPKPLACNISEVKECREESGVKRDRFLNPIHGLNSQDTANSDRTSIFVENEPACDMMKEEEKDSGGGTATEEIKCMSDNHRDTPDPESAVQGPPLSPNSTSETKEKERNRRGKQHRPRKRKWKMIGSILRFVTFGKMVGIGLIVFGKRALAITVTGIRWFLRSLLEGIRTVELLTVGACYKTSSTAFVTLKSRVAKSSAHQMFLSHVHYSMVVKSAPNPKDCIWENISIPARQIEMRKTIADCCLIVGAVFWSIVVGFITTIANLESLSKELPWLNAYRNTAIYDVLNQYLAVGVLLILLSILPFLFDVIARSYEGRKLESEIQNSIMTRYFYYQLANVFVSVGLGSIATSIHQILQNPSSILSILGTSLPTLSVYFTNLLIVKSFTAVPLELLRIWPLICVLSVRSCRNKNKCTIRELKRGIVEDYVSLDILIVLLVHQDMHNFAFAFIS